MRVLAAVLALAVWQLAAVAVNNRLLLVGPVEVAARLGQLVLQRDFWQTVWFTFTRVTGGFLLGFLLALVLAAVSARFPLVHTLLRPYLLAVKTVPVASFIVIALLWLFQVVLLDSFYRYNKQRLVSVTAFVIRQRF